MRHLAVLVAFSSLFLSACGNADARRAAGDAQAGPDAVVAELKGARITRSQLDAKLKSQLLQLRQQEYELRRKALDDMLGELLLKREAQARGVSVEDLLRSEVAAKVAEPSEAEVALFYERVKGQIGGKPLELVRPDLAKFLRERATETRAALFRRELLAKDQVKLSLEVPRFELKLAADAPTLGPADAPVTIVEYTDFQCPFCRRGQELVDQVLERYKGKVRLVHRDYPLDNHPRARPAAEASYCAGEQGHFFEFRRAALLDGSPQGDEDLRNNARKLGLDMSAFQSCVASQRHGERVQQALVEGQSLGVNSTPTFFINGRMMAGARSLEEFAAIIDEELLLADQRG